MYILDILVRGIVNGWKYFIKTPSRCIFIFTVAVSTTTESPYWLPNYFIQIILVDTAVALALGGTVRPTRCIRPFLLLSKSRTLRAITSTIISTLRKLVDLVLLILIVMVTYSVVGVQVSSLEIGILDDFISAV